MPISPITPTPLGNLSSFGAENNSSRQSVCGRLHAAGVVAQHSLPILETRKNVRAGLTNSISANLLPSHQYSKPSTPGKPIRHPEHNVDDNNFGITCAEEDCTVTARSRGASRQHTPPPPAPSMPFTHPLSQPTPFARSPTATLFSILVLSVSDACDSDQQYLPLCPSLSLSQLC